MIRKRNPYVADFITVSKSRGRAEEEAGRTLKLQFVVERVCWERDSTVQSGRFGGFSMENAAVRVCWGSSPERRDASTSVRNSERSSLGPSKEAEGADLPRIGAAARSCPAGGFGLLGGTMV